MALSETQNYQKDPTGAISMPPPIPSSVSIPPPPPAPSGMPSSLPVPPSGPPQLPSSGGMSLPPPPPPPAHNLPPLPTGPPNIPSAPSNPSSKCTFFPSSLRLFPPALRRFHPALCTLAILSQFPFSPHPHPSFFSPFSSSPASSRALLEACRRLDLEARTREAHVPGRAAGSPAQDDGVKGEGEVGVEG